VVTEPKNKTRSGAGPTDAALVTAARAGEAWAQQALLTRYARLVLGLAQRMLGNQHDADDLAQDVFIKALTRLDSLSNPQAFESWIASITVRSASKQLRKRALLTRLGLRRAAPLDLDLQLSASAPPDVAAEISLIYRLFERLSADERIALVLRRVEGMALPEIAEHTGLSLATVKRRLKAAEERLERAKGRL
jgi:RNA polymerase sigma-70 factor (ECF subfamily)